MLAAKVTLPGSVFLLTVTTPVEVRDKCLRPLFHKGLTGAAVESQPISRVPGPHSPQHSPSRYHSALGWTLFRSGVTKSVHLSVTVSPSLLKVTPNFSKNWTSKCVYGITEESGTRTGGDTISTQHVCLCLSTANTLRATASCQQLPCLILKYMSSGRGCREYVFP